jgi:predicted oxidoreductase
MEIVILVWGDNFKMNQNSNVKIEITSKCPVITAFRNEPKFMPWAKVKKFVIK